jgi:hypothetical protein
VRPEEMERIGMAQREHVARFMRERRHAITPRA